MAADPVLPPKVVSDWMQGLNLAARLCNLAGVGVVRLARVVEGRQYVEREPVHLRRVVPITMRVSADGHEVAGNRVGSEDTSHTGAQASPGAGAMIFQAMPAFEQPDECLGRR
jgi:hypothetical protein